ncbi:MAG: triphosphoribosyl-dephospho-CoA synthase [Gemmataceae bacterium]
MTLAADRDLVARQYANGYRELFDDAVPALRAGIARTGCLEGGILFTHLTLLSRHPDTLIVRKRGAAVAAEAADRAAAVLRAGWPDTAAGRDAMADLDRWLRGDGHARNPGTTADLIAATLFAELLTERIPLPLSVPWSRAELVPCQVVAT